MYKYMYVESNVGGRIVKSDHREIIDKYRKEGCMFVAMILKNVSYR